jgi:hypothetical protein
MKTGLLRAPTATTLLARLIDAPDLVRTVRALPEGTFSALVRYIGVEDAGEIVALATIDQLVALFDEGLFVNSKPGERETFDSARFVVWLEVLLEAGDDVAASRFAELSLDFVVQALSSVVLVLDHDALLARLSEGGEDAVYADKAIESSLSEELDGYLLISRRHDGWDAALALILALDKTHRPFLVRVLDRCADIAGAYIDDLDELSTVLSAQDSLSEDVEAEREDRRSRRGHVEPRAARSFLALARQPLPKDAVHGERDPITRAYFRSLENRTLPTDDAAAQPPPLAGLLSTTEVGAAPLLHEITAAAGAIGHRDGAMPLVEGMRLLNELDPSAFAERMEELVYLVNVLLAGAGTEGRRLRPADAVEAVLSTVGLGAELEARRMAVADQRAILRASPPELGRVLRDCRADLLFREASRTLVSRRAVPASIGFLRSRAELDEAIERL